MNENKMNENKMNENSRKQLRYLKVSF